MPAADDNILVEIKDLHFSYGDRPLFKGLSLQIPRGKVVAILGASGCGKTTLLQMIGGQRRPDRGEVVVDGQAVQTLGNDELFELRKKMGMMFQAGGLFTDLTTFENVAFPLRENFKLPEPVIRELVLMKLHAVGLRGAVRLMPSELSGGMSRRVALARAIVHDPILSMYDEPFAGLDPISLNLIAELIRRLNDALGTTSIIVTYDVSESLKLVDYVYVISDGVLAGAGTPDELLASDDPFLSQFLHALPDGPIQFHYPAARTLQNDLRLRE
ncbi:MAG: ABC transporter ATP-binding protein [Betaproteobacteria bacterium]|nr:ABC transporter ATP-binding protein [Betaproteobacteria bacterium]